MTEENTLRFFYVDPANVYENELYITGKEVHHMQHVIRLAPGANCKVLDGKGMTYVVTVEEYISPFRAKARIIERQQEKRSQPVYITIAQAIPQKKVFDRIVEKATELGVKAIIPLLTDRTSNKFSGEQSQSVIERWRDISIQAAKQSRQTVLPQIERPQSLYDIVDRKAGFDFVLMPFPGERKSINDVLSLVREVRRKSEGSTRLLLLIGPEGGFTAHERDYVLTNGGIAFSLGNNILKTDTAMVGCVTILTQCLS